MKKYKVLLEVKDFKEVEIELPFYAHCQTDTEEIYVKITHKQFKRITFHASGTVEMFRCNTHNELAAIWHENKSDWKQWQNAVNTAKEHIQSF